jgi:hypothetical protein
MKKNIIAIVVLAVLGLVAFLMFREKPDTQKKAIEDAIKPVEAAKVDEIRIKRQEGVGDKKKPESYTIKKKDGKWKMTVPVDYEVVESTVESMTKALSELRVIDIISEKASSHDKFGVGDKDSIDMTALSGSKELVHLIIGGSNNGVTFVRLPDKNEVYRMKGSFKFNFDRSVKSMRDKTIIKADIETLKTATFGAGESAIALEKTGADKDLSVKLVGKQVANFDAAKATGVIRTLVNLNAVDFVDGDAASDETKLFGPDAYTVSVDAQKDGKPYQVTLTMGNKVADKAQVYAKTSLSKQVFLIAEYTAGRLKPKMEDWIKKEDDKKAADSKTGGAKADAKNPSNKKPAEKTAAEKKPIEKNISVKNLPK